MAHPDTDKLPWKKIVVWGSGASGKTSLLIRHITKEFPGEYIPTVFDISHFPVDINGQKHSVGLWDTSVREDGDRLAMLSCPQTDLFIFCFTPTYIQSLKAVSPGGFYWNIVENYYRTLAAIDEPRAPVILVELGTDRRTLPEIQERLKEKGTDFVTQEEIEEAVKQMGAVCFHATSALNNTGVSELFNEIIPRVLAENPLKRQTVKKSRCSVS